MEMKGKMRINKTKKEKLKCSNTRPSQKLLEDLAQAIPISPRQDHSSDVWPVFVQLTQANPITPKREIT